MAYLAWEAAKGAVIGGGIDLALQLATNGGNLSCVDWGRVGHAALVGGVTGGVLGGLFRSLGLAKGVATARAGKLYHYTSADPEAIASQGLRAGSAGKVFTTPNGGLSPLQAQLDLALPPTRAIPQHLIEIDVNTLTSLGIDVPAPNLIGRAFNMPGGGLEVVFPHGLPASALTVLR